MPPPPPPPATPPPPGPRIWGIRCCPWHRLKGRVFPSPSPLPSRLPSAPCLLVILSECWEGEARAFTQGRDNAYVSLAGKSPTGTSAERLGVSQGTPEARAPVPSPASPDCSTFGLAS